MTTATAGNFSLDTAGHFAGPADYMADRGNAKLEEIVAGGSAGFRAMMALAPVGTTVEQLIVVAMQTDFAAWRGQQQLAAMCRASAPAAAAPRGQISLF